MHTFTSHNSNQHTRLIITDYKLAKCPFSPSINSIDTKVSFFVITTLTSSNAVAQNKLVVEIIFVNKLNDNLPYFYVMIEPNFCIYTIYQWVYNINI